MSAIGDALADLAAAAASVEGVYAYELGANLTPPGVVVEPPRLEPSTACSGATTGFFTVFVVVALDDRALERLYELTPAVTEAIERLTPAVWRAATPGTYSATGTGPLPAYEITVEYPL